MLEYLLTPESLLSLLVLTLMEIVLGIDNIVFISIVSNKLKGELRRKARNIGLILAMIFRVILLFGIAFVMKLTKPFKIDHEGFIQFELSWYAIIMFLGGLFLLYKSVSEIHHKLEGDEHDEGKGRSANSLTNAIVQIAGLNIVFSFDSILTAIGMVELAENWSGPLNPGILIMIIAVVISIVVMMLFAGPVSRFVNEHPSVQVLGLSFLLLIGFMLMAEGAHVAHLKFGEAEMGVIPKGYLYFAIFFSMLVEFFNFRLRRKTTDPVVLHNPKLEDESI